MRTVPHRELNSAGQLHHLTGLEGSRRVSTGLNGLWGSVLDSHLDTPAASAGTSPEFPEELSEAWLASLVSKQMSEAWSLSFFAGGEAASS